MSDKLILRRRPSLDIAIEDFDVLFGTMPVGRVYHSPDAEVWHWRISVTLADVKVDERGRASFREGAMAAFREKWGPAQAGRAAGNPAACVTLNSDQFCGVASWRWVLGPLRAPFCY